MIDNYQQQQQAVLYLNLSIKTYSQKTIVYSSLAQMNDHHHSEEYVNKSINSLVEELNMLGNKSVVIQKTYLIAVQNGENKHIKRYQSKSIPRRQFFKFTNNNGSQKKYFYDEVVVDFNKQIAQKFMDNWQQGYNTSIIIQNKKEYLLRVIQSMQSYVDGCLVFMVALNERNELIDILGGKNITHRQLLENKRYYEVVRTNGSSAFLMIGKIKQYLLGYVENENYRQEKTLIDITFKHPQTCAELHLTALPSEFFIAECSPPYSLIKTQLIQLLNYIKMNPNKRYEHISKLITKRLPITNYLTRIFMSDSRNVVVNFIDNNDNNIRNFDGQKSVGKFELFDKLAIVSNLLRKADRTVIQMGSPTPLLSKQQYFPQHQQSLTTKNKERYSKSISRSKQEEVGNNNYNKKQQQQQFISPIARLNMRTEDDNHNSTQQQKQILQRQQQIIEQKQFQFCRSLERKTHKYSISPRNEASSSRRGSKNKQTMEEFANNKQQIEKKTIAKYQSLSDNNYNSNNNNNEFTNVEISQKQNYFLVLHNHNNYTQQTAVDKKQTKGLSQSQQIVLLKAQHAREISQYHQTIQLLNRKIMILTKQLNLEELYKIHEREIMLLEMKIKELRGDVEVVVSEGDNQNQLKKIIKKLTAEIKSLQSSSISKKLSHGRVVMIEKQLQEVKEKLMNSEKSRSLLNLQVETLTKRLRIRDSQIQKINQQDVEKYQAEDLSMTEQEILEQVKKLVVGIRNQQRNSAEYLLRKVSFILSDLSKSRDIILECNDFLVQLMEILDEKVSKKAPQIVLDCNKFIRTFLMDNLAIF